MVKIYVKTTESCNLHCKHCYINDFRNKTSFFDEDQTINWLKEYFKFYNFNIGDILISFHGGEPFLCPLSKMQKVVDAFPGASFDATSNLCYPLAPEILDFIQKNFKDSFINNKAFIKTSWDYKIRFRDGKEQGLWWSNVKTLMKENILVKPIICLTSILINEVRPWVLLKMFKDNGISFIDFERLTENTTEDKSLLPDLKAQDDYLYYLWKASKEYDIKVGMFEELENVASGFQGCRKRKCMEEVITINADGSIGGCPNTSLLVPFTNIKESPSLLKANKCRLCLINKEQTWNPLCYSCEVFKWCNGDCHQLGWQGNVCSAPKKILLELYGKH